jgi:hypothetical protein
MPESIWNRLIKIGSSQYLTSDGTSGGTPIITDVSGLDALRPAKIGPVVASMGAPKKFLRTNLGANVPITITVFKIPDAANSTLDDVISVHDSAESSTGIVRLTITGGNDAATIDCYVGQENTPGVTYPGGFIVHGSEILKIDCKLNYTVIAFA